MAEKILTEDELIERCGYWQKRLKLSDWDIKVTIKRLSQLSKRGCAEIDYWLDSEGAEVSILDPLDYTDYADPQDMEQGLVHELIHIVFAHWETDGDLEKLIKEQATERVSWALVNLDREIKYKATQLDPEQVAKAAEEITNKRQEVIGS